MSVGDQRPDRRVSRSDRRSTLALLGGAAAAVLLGACGGSSSTAASSAAGSASAGVKQTSVQAARGVRPIPRALGAGEPLVGPTRPVRARPRAGTVNDEVSASGARALDPCTLVTPTEAGSILGKPVGKPVDAQQGPTCIYQARGAKDFVTLAVVATHFSTVKPQAQLRDRISLTIGGHSAYCGVAGSPTLIVPLSAGRFLSVVAPCPIAASFAGRAVSRIG